MKEKRLTGAVAEISLDAAARNYLALRARTKAKFCCVVKANAYGHGAAVLGTLYERLGADYLAVATADEALALRRAGIRTPILILGYVPPEFAARAACEHLTLTVYDRVQAEALAAEARGGQTDVHLKIDTGMGRLGFLPGDAAEAAGIIGTLAALRITGIYTHLACADEGAAGREATERQLHTFRAAVTAVEDVLGRRLLRHAANSAGLLCYPDGAFDMVRAGLALYGYNAAEALAATENGTPKETSARTGALPTTMAELVPILTLRAPLVSVKELPSGSPIGYGGTFVTRRPSKIGILPLGYADGIARLAGAHGCMVSVGDALAPVVGRVCMDQTLIDLTDVGGAVGDTVTLFGKAPGARLCDWAEKLGAIPYELLTSLGTRITRVYK